MRERLLRGMRLLPVPPLDGGTLLKWTLVARGRTQAEADEAVRRLNWAPGVAASAVGVGLAVTGKHAAGVLVLGSSALVCAIAAGKLR